jgi:catechol 2,3-dioxygenase-like lactoylglutathione lyase family enzyme
MAVDEVFFFRLNDGRIYDAWSLEGRPQVAAECAGSRGAGTAGDKVPEPGGWNRFQIEVDDLEKFANELRTAGANFRGEITEGKGGKQILLKDPSGNVIELFEPA